MTAVRNRQTNKETMVDAVRRLESRLFVGRKAERTLFLHHLLDESTEKRILNVYGPGGVGKSSLLDEFRRLVKKAGWLYLYLDSRDIPRPPDGLSEEVLAAFHAAPPERRLVLALDTYEEMGDLDRWLRERFLPGLPSRVLVVIAGRLPLQGAWRASPAWRQLIHPLPLEGFDLPLTRQYLERCGIQDEAVVRDTWAFTLGHPLALSLAAALAQENSSPGLATLGRAEAVRELARCWLREVPDEELRALVEAAAVVRRFDQEILGHLTGRPVSAAEFDRLTALSFSRLGQEGWALHDLVRAVIAREVR
ncbi:MAG: ATP-binding protein, partial [Actinobacteria bacterium]|nr:ATP-binding protein [Actinomycetota bacterium]